jgi:hypothetical protein
MVYVVMDLISIKAGLFSNFPANGYIELISDWSIFTLIIYVTPKILPSSQKALEDDFASS